MSFSELSLAKHDTGLSYDEETLTLYGEKRGFGITITDGSGEYIIKIYAEAPYKYEKEIAGTVNSLSEELPKNAVNCQRCGKEQTEIRLCRDLFLQENLPLMLDFADRLISALSALGLKGAAARLPEKPAEPVPEQKRDPRKIRLSFDLNSVKGLFGALIGAAAMVFISSALVRVKTSDSIGSTFAEIGSYILSAAATVLIFFDYRFLARKLDAFGVIVCPVISVLCAVFSALLIAARAYSSAAGITAAEAFADLGGLYEASPETASFCAGYLAISAVISVFASIACCLRYFGKHPDEMIKNEKTRKNDER